MKPLLALSPFPLFLAQSAPTGALSWLEVYFWVVGGVLGTVLLVRQFLPGRDARQITLVRDAVQRAEFEKERSLNSERHDRAAAARKLIHQQQDNLNAKLTGVETASLHASREITQLREQITTADARHDQQLDKIHTRIDHLPARLAEQLRLARHP